MTIQKTLVEAEAKAKEAKSKALESSEKLEAALLGKDKEAIAAAHAESDDANYLLEKREQDLSMAIKAVNEAKKPAKKIKIISKRRLSLNGGLTRLKYNEIAVVENTPEIQRAIELKLVNVI